MYQTLSFSIIHVIQKILSFKLNIWSKMFWDSWRFIQLVWSDNLDNPRVILWHRPKDDWSAVEIVLQTVSCLGSEINIDSWFENKRSCKYCVSSTKSWEDIFWIDLTAIYRCTNNPAPLRSRSSKWRIVLANSGATARNSCQFLFMKINLNIILQNMSIKLT